jgi:Fic family protein
MDASLFEGTNSGGLVSTIDGMQAFVPNKLPPNINLGSIINEFGEASAALGGLSEIGSTISNPYMVIRPLQRNEALRSSAMEGTFSTADDLALVEALDETADNNSTREVRNYVRAIDFAIDQIKTLPISHRLIRGMHAVLLEQATKARGSNKRPGEYKIHQNWIGARQIQKARFIPPPPASAQDCMDSLEAFINTDTAPLPPLIATGLSHYQFETIHPFSDGNGRVGRMLITLELLDKRLLSSPLLYVSSYIEANKDEYIDAMFAVSSQGDWERWLRFFLLAIKESCAETTKTIGRLNELQERYRDLLHAKSKSMSALSIADHLFENPVISITDASKICGTSYQSAKKNVEQLLRLGILQQVRGFENPKLYWAREVIDISDGR